LRTEAILFSVLGLAKGLAKKSLSQVACFVKP